MVFKIYTLQLPCKALEMPQPSILIIGSGPVGLWLAYSLRRAASDLDVLVIDKLPSRSLRNRFSKALSMSAGTLETFHTRGVAQQFLDLGTPMPKTHFGGLPVFLSLSKEVTGAKYGHGLLIPQVKTEGVLLELCEEVGVKFAWGRTFETLTQDSTSVQVTALTETGEKEVLEASWVVGCDGTHSLVRQTVEIPFRGTASTMHSIVADFKLSEPPPSDILFGKKETQGGARLLPIGDDLYRISIKNGPATMTKEAPTFERVKEALITSFGTDFGAHNPVWISRVGNACRVAERFRKGRVLLAGDAGHQVFPAGGQGMNLGIQDAETLAWRLELVTAALEMGSEEVEKLLGGYSMERVGAAKAVVDNVQAQMAILMAKTVPEMALKDVFCETLKNAEINAMWARRVAGFDEGGVVSRSDDVQEADELVGTRVTSRVIGGSMAQLFNVLSLQKFILVQRSSSNRVDIINLDSVSKQWAERVANLQLTVAAEDESWGNLEALLLRPDMRIAWVARSKHSADEVRASLAIVLERWFGASV